MKANKEEMKEDLKLSSDILHPEIKIEGRKGLEDVTFRHTYHFHFILAQVDSVLVPLDFPIIDISQYFASHT